jgi:hypothetical protein
LSRRSRSPGPEVVNEQGRLTAGRSSNTTMAPLTDPMDRSILAFVRPQELRRSGHTVAAGFAMRSRRRRS